MLLFNLAKMTTATTGSGTTVVLGSAVSGYLTFAQSGLTDGITTSYGIVDGTNTEVGRGSSSGSISSFDRTTVLKSTNSGSRINLSGNAQIYLTGLAEDFSAIFIDQSGGTGDTYGSISGSISGSNVSFQVSAKFYTSGTLLVFLNGQLLTQGSSEDWVETYPSSGSFSFNTAPISGDNITVLYATTNVTTMDIDGGTY